MQRERYQLSCCNSCIDLRIEALDPIYIEYPRYYRSPAWLSPYKTRHLPVYRYSNVIQSFAQVTRHDRL